ncbi:MAG: hypothetical protein LJE60_08815 [Thiocapsa sp.]|nr:hypothetical protein [Thiocapsa sp.]MCG6897190.1 hypothetical protein [Thiocapsa sp.]
MAGYLIRETFFRPGEIAAKQRTSIPAAVFNGLQLLLKRSQGDCVFVPIRSMQYQAVVDREEVIFVDSHGGYAHQNGEGGRLIRIAWRPAVAQASLSAPIPCEIIHYFKSQEEIQMRLLGEIQPTIRQMLDRQRHGSGPRQSARILPFRRTD